MTSTPVHLGLSGLRVSPLCLGTMNFGPHTSEADSHAILDAADQAGVHFVDTANVYGARYGEGWTEQIVGNWFAQGGGRRDRTVLATKLFGEMGPGPNEFGLSALAIRRQCDASLRRLQTDYIDLYQMHHIDRSAPWEELWEAFDVLKQAGKILYVGSSNFPGWALAQGNERAARRGSVGLVSEQSYYNLLQRTVELEVVPACQAYGIGLIPWSPLEQGLLGGVLRKQSQGRSAGERQLEKLEKHRAAVQAYEAFCDQLGEEPANVALAWLLHQPAVTAPIIGPRTLQQLQGSLRAPEIVLDDAALTRLDEIFPGPGGAAPEAYAW
jgi:aryl-alcohol dehydrogenase-like predicted oxidoreductase